MTDQDDDTMRLMGADLSRLFETLEGDLFGLMNRQEMVQAIVKIGLDEVIQTGLDYSAAHALARLRIALGMARMSTPPDQPIASHNRLIHEQPAMWTREVERARRELEEAYQVAGAGKPH